MKPVLLARAVADRTAHFDYLEARNPQAAIDQDERVMEQLGRLAEYPELGRPGRRKGTRELVIKKTPLIAVYRVKSKQRIEVIRLLHGSQQYGVEKKEA